MASTFITRRGLIKGAGALAAGSAAPPLLFSSPAKAVAPAVIAAAIVLVAKVLDFFKRSGDLTLELNALNVKIDQVLQNQILIMAALEEIDRKVEDIQSKIADLPAETVSLQQAINAQALSSTLANAIQTLVKHPTDVRSRADYSDYREELNKIAASLYAVVSQTTVTPALAVGTKYALHGLLMFSKFDKRFGFTAASDHAKLTAISLNVIQTLEGITGPSGLQRYVELTRQKMPTVTDNIVKSPFFSLLPKDFSEVDKSAANGNGGGASTTVPFCMMSGFDRVQIAFTRPVMGNPRTGTPFSPGSSTTRDTRSIKHIDYTVVKYIAYGGRPLYNVDVPAQSTWKSDSFSRVVFHRISYADVVQSSEPIAKTAGCLEMPNAPQGSPEVFSSFTTLLGAYAALAAMEGRFLALQQSALQDLESANKLDAALKHA